MKKLAFAILVMCVSIGAEAQKVFFVYLQSENRTPFYVRLSDKVYSSSSSGYLILSNLKDSVYALSVGRPGTKNAESRFSIPVEGSDKGFLLKNFDDGPGLFDLQTLAIHKPLTEAGSSELTTSRTDPFTRRLAKAADDESLLTVPVVAKAEAPKSKEGQKAPAAQVAKADTVQEAKREEPATVDTVSATASNPSVKVEKPVQATPPAVTIIREPEIKVQDTIAAVQAEQPKQQPVQPAAESTAFSEETFKRSLIKRRSESSTTEGFGLVFLDIQETGTDTIRLLIPNPKKAVVLTDEIASVTDQAAPVISASKDNEAKKELITAPVKSKNNCIGIATEKDFLKLRKNMAAESNDEEMIGEAKKYFRSRCFTTEQVRYLSTLFLTNAAKYQFFDAAYPYVSDPILFPSLGSEIKDEYYSKRFKALIGE